MPLPCKPDSVRPEGLDGHFSHPAGAGRPACAECDYYPGFLTGGPPFPCFVLHHARFAVPSGCPDSRWALTPPFHPCLCPCGPSAVSFCCTVCPGSSRFPSPTFMRRVALWCPDFPHLPLARKLRPSGERHPQAAPARRAFQGKHSQQERAAQTFSASLACWQARQSETEGLAIRRSSGMTAPQWSHFS